MTPARGSGTDKVAPPPWLPQVPGRCSELQRGRVGLSRSQPGQGQCPRGLDRGSAGCWEREARPSPGPARAASLRLPARVLTPPSHGGGRLTAIPHHHPPPSHPLTELCPRNLAWGTQGIWLHLRHPSPPPAQPGGRFQVAKERGLTLHVL